MSAHSWRTRARCRGIGPSLFYNVHPAAVAAAKAICTSCPVRSDCAASAVAARDAFGVWGGLTADERPAPPRTSWSATGPDPTVSDAELRDLFIGSHPSRRALAVLLEYRRMPTATAYKTLQRAVRLGLVERRGRSLYPSAR